MRWIYLGCLSVLVAGILWSDRTAALARPEGDGAGGDAAPAAKNNSGWLGIYQSASGKSHDVRHDRLVALHVPAGKPATPLLPAGPFRVTWKANLPLQFKGDYTFRAAGQGKVRVEVNGAVALAAEGDLRKGKGKPLGLKRGDNAVVVHYSSPEKGDASVRLLWQGEDFPPEPLGLAQVEHDAKDRALLTGQSLRRGRELLAQHHCLKCHTADTTSWVRSGAMPELEADAPSLVEIGARLQPAWLARWVQDPQALRPTASMPRLLHGAVAGDKGKLDDRARDIAVYLSGLGKKDGKSEVEAKKEVLESGIRLFANLGCIACHLAPERDDFYGDEYARVPLRDVVAKWQPAALRAFLRQPDQHYSWIRMPNFNLSATEVEQLAAYLLSVKPREVFADKLGGGDAKRGKELVGSLGCTACHLLESKRTAPAAALPFAKLSKDSAGKGCLAAKPTKSPVFAFTAENRADLAAAIAGDRASLKRDSAGEFARRQLVSLRCRACHKRDGQDDLWTQLKEENDGLTADLTPLPPSKEDEKFSPGQLRPPLTWIGEKLRPEWTTQLLAGKLKYKPRPYLRARMPAFPRRAELLAQGLAFEHGYSAVSPAHPVPDDKLADVGRLLAGKSKWGCNGCHACGSASPVGVFEAPGVNFAYVRERLRRDYFDRWLWSPTRVEPGTKMPTVYTWGQPSGLPAILGGDAQKQIDALWNFLQEGHKIKPPAES